MIDLARRFFSKENVSLEHENPIVFVTSQWQSKIEPNRWYLVYRLLVAMFAIVSWIFSILDLRVPNQSASQRAKWLIYLTSWGFTLITVQATLAAGMVIGFFVSAREQDATGPASGGNYKGLKLYKMYWVTNVTATDLAFGITIIYWSFVYDAKKMPLDAMNIIVHVFNSLIMMLDACIASHPVRPLHCYWPVLLGVCYAVFSAIYYLAGGLNKEGTSYIYKILNWNQPRVALITCTAVMVFLVFLHMCYYFLYRLRLRIHSLICSRRHKKDENAAKMWYDNVGLATESV